MNKHRFILGIGSQRAGSTLLHRLLAQSSDVFMHPLKELHYFDTLHGYRPGEALKKYSLSQLSREINRIVEARSFEFMNDRYRCYIRSNRLLAWTEVEHIEYHDLFRPFLSRYRLLGEITPEYMLLNEDAILKMREIIGADAGIVLICRNPVDRLLSAAKLFNVYNNLNMDSPTANQWLRQQLDQHSPWIQAQDAYNDYASASERYARHFRHFVAIAYETLIADPLTAARQLADGLAIRIDANRFAEGVHRVVNDLGDGVTWSEETQTALSLRYEAISAHGMPNFPL